jgi:hypothetical protein
MRLWTMPLRFLGIIVLAALVSGAWLLRRDLVQKVWPEKQGALRPTTESPVVPAREAPTVLARAKDKLDSLHGWSADSVVLSASEAVALIMDAVPPEARRHIDSVALRLSEGTITATGKVETAAIPKSALGPFASALEPWERVTASGPVLDRESGRAAWQVNTVTIRGFTLPQSATHSLIAQSLPSVKDGALPFALPRGIYAIRVRPRGVVMYRQVRQ